MVILVMICVMDLMFDQRKIKQVMDFGAGHDDGCDCGDDDDDDDDDDDEDDQDGHHDDGDVW